MVYSAWKLNTTKSSAQHWAHIEIVKAKAQFIVIQISVVYVWCIYLYTNSNEFIEDFKRIGIAKKLNKK